MNAVTTQENTQLAAAKPAGPFDMAPRTFDDAWRMAEILAASDLVPKDFKGKPENCLIAMQWGAEVGLKALQSLQGIAVINGRPAMWGDSLIALARNSPLCEYVVESDDGHTATCKVKRRGEPEQSRTFSMDDAKRAGLAGKQGPWVQYPARMRQLRARAFALRDVFPDVLRGLPVAEEVMDYPQDMGQADVVTPSPWTPDLLTAAAEAAAKGAKAYAAWWKTLGKELQTQLAGTPEHQRNKDKAQHADAARTVEAPAPAAVPAADPQTGEIVPTVAEVKARLDAADTEDALYAAFDLFNALPEAEQEQHRADIEAVFDGRLKSIRGE